MPATAPLIPPPVVSVAAIGLQALLTRRVAPRDLPGRRTLAASLVAASAVLPVLASRGFAAHDTTYDPIHPEQATTLVTDGAFAVTRNPMYVGMAGLVLANAVRTGRFRSLLPLAGVVSWLDRVQIPAEEAALTAGFGTAYHDYRARVRRWL